MGTKGSTKGDKPKKENPSSEKGEKAIKEQMGKTLDKLFGPKRGDGSNRS